MLICPVCEQSLESRGRTFLCASKHTFDRARSGYVNLLLQHKAGAQLTGDTAEMLRCRRAFLEQGYFEFLIDVITRRARQAYAAAVAAGSTGPAAILDVGCGEGCYLGRLEQALSAGRGLPEISFFGLDLSKAAVQLAAARYKRVQLIVADAYQRIPLRSDGVLFLLNVCAPRNFPEFLRLMQPQGECLIVTTLPQHMQELRSYLKLLKIEPEKERNILEAAAGFELRDRILVEHKVSLTPAAAAAAVKMTPNFWHQESSNLEVLARLDQEVEVTFAFIALCLGPQGKRRP